MRDILIFFNLTLEFHFLIDSSNHLQFTIIDSFVQAINSQKNFRFDILKFLI